jgi:hypothetical protein
MSLQDSIEAHISDRTIIGLKSIDKHFLYHIKYCFNRTIIGLKFITLIMENMYL